MSNSNQRDIFAENRLENFFDKNYKFLSKAKPEDYETMTLAEKTLYRQYIDLSDKANSFNSIGEKKLVSKFFSSNFNRHLEYVPKDGIIANGKNLKSNKKGGDKMAISKGYDVWKDGKVEHISLSPDDIKFYENFFSERDKKLEKFNKKGGDKVAKQSRKSVKSKWSEWNNPTPDKFPTREVRTKSYSTKNFNVSVVQEKDLKGIPVKDKGIFETHTHKVYTKKGLTF